jgi:hypothetical protein
MKFDIAQICENGHVISSFHLKYPENHQDFCDRCGAPTLIACPACHTPIRGNLIDEFSALSYQVPKFCSHCGAPFPWTAAALRAAIDFARALESVDEEEKTLLVADIQDLIQETPVSSIAAVRFRQIMRRIGATTAAMFREILVNVLSEAAKKSLFF